MVTGGSARMLTLGATTTFAERGIGDVLLAWENEAYLAVKKLGADKVEIVVPSISILAEPPVAVVDEVVERRGTREIATAYLTFLYSPEGQAIAEKHFYRTKRDDKLFTIDARFGGWAKAQPTHFAEDGLFDQISASAR